MGWTTPWLWLASCLSKAWVRQWTQLQVNLQKPLLRVVSALLILTVSDLMKRSQEWMFLLSCSQWRLFTSHLLGSQLLPHSIVPSFLEVLFITQCSFEWARNISVLCHHAWKCHLPTHHHQTSQLMWLYCSGVPGSTVLILTSLGDHRWQQSQPLFKKITSSKTTHLPLDTVFQNLCRLPEDEIHITFLRFLWVFPNMLPWFYHLWCSTQRSNGSHAIVLGRVRFSQFWQFQCLPWW